MWKNYASTQGECVETRPGIVKLENFIDNINKNSLKILENCKLEASLKNYKLGESYQFMRLGYFTPDLKNCTENNLVFNKSVSLKESFKIN